MVYYLTKALKMAHKFQDATELTNFVQVQETRLQIWCYEKYQTAACWIEALIYWQSNACRSNSSHKILSLII